MVTKETRNKSKEYWTERSILKKERLLKSDVQFMGEVAKKYDSLMRDYSTRLGNFYGKYSESGILTYSESIKRLTAKEQIEFIKYIDTLPNYDSDFRLYLKNLRTQEKISRLQQMKLEHRVTATQLSLWQNAEFPDHIEKSLMKAYSLTLKELDVADIGVLNRKRVQQILSQNWSGVKFSDTIWQNKEKLISSLDRTLADQFLRNAPLKDAVKNIRDATGTSFSNAERLIRTESAYVVEQATAEAYTDAGIEKYQFVAVEDERTSDICSDLDGKVFLLSEAQEGVNYPPMHPNCRSTTIPAF
jgi:SPP1 gp7 family putative phage head morphogenesis protein